MKLAEGQTAYIGKEKFTAEVPDDKAKKVKMTAPAKKEAEKK